MQTHFRSAAELVAQCLRDDPTFGMMTPAEQRAEARMLMTKVEGCDPDDVDVQMEALALASQPVTVSASSRVVDLGRRRIVVAAPRLDAHGALEVAVPDIARPVVDQAPEAPPTASARVFEAQLCRNLGGCTERLGATGRCMDCGAQRREPPAMNIARLAPKIDPVHNARIVSAKVQGKKQIKTRKDANPMPKLPTSERQTPEAYARRRGAMLRGGIMERVKGLTNAPDHYLARLIGRTRPTVQAYLAGRIEVTLNRWQVGQLKTLLEQQRLALDDALDELEAMIAMSEGGVG